MNRDFPLPPPAVPPTVRCIGGVLDGRRIEAKLPQHVEIVPVRLKSALVTGGMEATTRVKMEHYWMRLYHYENGREEWFYVFEDLDLATLEAPA